MLVETIRRRVVEAMKAGDDIQKSILRVALGEIQAAQVRAGRDLPDPEAEAVLRKLLKANEDSMAVAPHPEQRERLARESEVIRTLLPRTLVGAELEAALGPVRDAIRTAKSAGQATGIAMKHLKAAGAAVEGHEVARVVGAMRV